MHVTLGHTWLVVGATVVASLRAAAGLLLIGAPLLAFVWGIDDGRPVAELVSVFLLSAGAGLLGLCLPNGYFRSRGFERGGNLYAPAGVRLFKRYLTWEDPFVRALRAGTPRLRVGPTEDSLRDYLETTRMSESAHLALLLAAVPPTAYAFANGWPGLAAFLCLANVVFNLYPVLVQRYNRPRVIHVLAHRSIPTA